MPHEKAGLIEDRSPGNKKLTLEDFRLKYGGTTDYSGSASFTAEEAALADKIGMPNRNRS